MKALVKYQKGNGFVEICDVPVPALEEDEVLIKVSACGICGSDVHIFHDEFPNAPPVIMGHELSGTIAKVGNLVFAWSPGDRVVTELHTAACGRCKLCRTGNQHICPAKRPIGSKTNGGFAEYIKVPERLVHRIPGNVDLFDAAITEPTAICIHSLLEFGKVTPGDFVVILGPGPIGLISALIAKEIGAGHIVITGTNKDEAVRLKTAGKFGLDAVINVERKDLTKAVGDLSGGIGADVVIEASGAPAAINRAVQISCRQGSIIAIGLTQKEQISLTWNEAVIKETKIFMPFSSTWTSWEQALQFLSKGVIDAKILTNRRPLEEWKEAIDDLENGRAIKTLLTIQENTPTSC